MIAANELRIGNWFQQDASNNNTISRFFTVDEIKRYGVRSTYIRQDTNQPHTSLFSLDSIHPIPLTPEILEKCGFTLNHVDQLAIVLNSMDRHLELNAEVNGNYFFSINQMGEFGDSSNVTLNYIQHLHQLQNLYWCLCGKELEINLQ